jgi:hypothetical protein
VVKTKAKDLTGCKFGKLYVKDRAPNDVRFSSMWNCICDCGTVLVVDGRNLYRDRKKHCGCDFTPSTVAMKRGAERAIGRGEVEIRTCALQECSSNFTVNTATCYAHLKKYCSLKCKKAAGRKRRGGKIRVRADRLCKCGCGEKQPKGRYAKYLTGHVPKRAKKTTKPWYESRGSRIKKLFSNAIDRCKVSGREWDYGARDELLTAPPEGCPICNRILNWGVPLRPMEEGCPSLDRIDSLKGYTKGNVKIICLKCNTVKRNSSVSDLEQLLKYMKQEPPV